MLRNISFVGWSPSNHLLFICMIGYFLCDFFRAYSVTEDGTTDSKVIQAFFLFLSLLTLIDAVLYYFSYVKEVKEGAESDEEETAIVDGKSNPILIKVAPEPLHQPPSTDEVEMAKVVDTTAAQTTDAAVAVHAKTEESTSTIASIETNKRQTTSEQDQTSHNNNAAAAATAAATATAAAAKDTSAVKSSSSSASPSTFRLHAMVFLSLNGQAYIMNILGSLGYFASSIVYFLSEFDVIESNIVLTRNTTAIDLASMFVFVFDALLFMLSWYREHKKEYSAAFAKHQQQVQEGVIPSSTPFHFPKKKLSDLYYWSNVLNLFTSVIYSIFIIWSLNKLEDINKRHHQVTTTTDLNSQQSKDAIAALRVDQQDIIQKQRIMYCTSDLLYIIYCVLLEAAWYGWFKCCGGSSNSSDAITSDEPVEAVKKQVSTAEMAQEKEQPV